MSTLRKILSLSLGAVLFVSASTTAQAVSPMPNNSTSGPSVERHTDRCAHFTEPKVIYSDGTATVTFSDTQTGETYKYTFTRVSQNTSTFSSEAQPLTVNPTYVWVSDGWVLNRQETKELIDEGKNAATIYAIIALIPGASIAALGAIIEGRWADKANTYYGRGNCIKINPWLHASEVKKGQRGCF